MRHLFWLSDEQWCRWCECPTEYGPSTTIYNRFNRWSRKRFWIELVEALATSGAVTKSTSIGITYRQGASICPWW
jgi:transposase